MKYLLIGLGNPGAKFTNTRHNIGINVLREWVEYQNKSASKVTPWQKHPRANAETALIKTAHHEITGVFPLTFMNNSGDAITPLVKGKWWQFKTVFPPTHILIIHDDLDLPLGHSQLKPGGSARGHNGVRSIHHALGTTNIPRLLIGISRPPDLSVKDYVLQNLSSSEQDQITSTLPQYFNHLDSFIKSSA